MLVTPGYDRTPMVPGEGRREENKKKKTSHYTVDMTSKKFYNQLIKKIILSP